MQNFHYLQRGMKHFSGCIWPFHVMWGGYSHYLLSPGMPIWQSNIMGTWPPGHVHNIPASYPWVTFVCWKISPNQFSPAALSHDLLPCWLSCAHGITLTSTWHTYHTSDTELGASFLMCLEPNVWFYKISIWIFLFRFPLGDFLGDLVAKTLLS